MCLYLVVCHRREDHHSSQNMAPSSAPLSPKSSIKSYGTFGNEDTESSASDDGGVHGTDYRRGDRHEPSLDRQRRKSFIEEDADLAEIEPPTQKKKEEVVTWSSLPYKPQLAILTIARLSEPLVQTSLRVCPSYPSLHISRAHVSLLMFPLQSYLFYQLKSFDPSLPDATIASQAGIMQGAFAAAQLCTAMLWGRFSDGGGRKRVLLVGLSGTMLSCLGFGFSKTFYQALVFRMLGGALNGNVGVMRTMISEIVREKK